jgi:hypothetical protein
MPFLGSITHWVMLGSDMKASTMAEEDHMIGVQFTVPNRHQGDLEWDVVATLHIDGPHLEVEGDQGFAEVRDIEVLDVDTGRSLTFDADLERWARNLPQAFRSGDLVCRVTVDSTSETPAREAIASRD